MTKSLHPSVDINGAVIADLKSPFKYKSRDTLSTGMSWFPGYAIDLDRGRRLNMMFSESFLTDQFTGDNLIWDPLFPTGSKSFIFVNNSTYDEGKAMEEKMDSILYTLAPGKKFTTKPVYEAFRKLYLSNVMWAGLMGRVPKDLNSLFPLNSSEVRAKLRVERSFESYDDLDSTVSKGDFSPLYEFEISGLSPNVASTSVGSSALDMIRVVPNPYYSVSGYESSQIENKVKIVNIPTECVISIFNLSGTLVRQFNFNQSNIQGYVANRDGINSQQKTGQNFQTFQDWDLKNQAGIPIASGVYIIHVKSDRLGEKIIKWFGVLRPIDLDSFN